MKTGIIFGFALSCCFSVIDALPPTLYVAGYDSQELFAVDPSTGSYRVVVTLPGTNRIGGVAITTDGSSAYLPTYSGNLFKVNLDTGSTEQLPLAPSLLAINGISLLNDTTAFVGQGLSGIFKIDLSSGSTSLLVSIPGDQLVDIEVASDTTGYAVGFDADAVYTVNLNTGAYTTLSTGVLSNPSDIALDLPSKGYVAASTQNDIYVIDLSTGAKQVITTTPLSATPDDVYTLAINPSANTGYGFGYLTNEIFQFDLTSGISSTFLTFPGSPGLYFGYFFSLAIPSGGVSGNNLSLLNYLNTYAPRGVVASYAFLGSALNEALESTAPTRNAFATYSSQIGLASSSLALSNHIRNNRYLNRSNQQNIALKMAKSENLIAGPVQNHKQSGEPCSNCSQIYRPKYDLWLSPFGEYAKEKAQNQTPEFTMNLGGAVGGFDCIFESGSLVGGGCSYIYNHVAQDNNAGHANMNQGYLTIYGSIRQGNYHIDLAAWGGYYWGHNNRHVVFPGVNETAKSTISGWQAAPHCEVGYSVYQNAYNGTLESRFDIEFYVGADWVANWEKGFNERGAGSYNMGQNGRFSSFLRGAAGLRFDQKIDFQNGANLIIQEGAAYVYQKSFSTGNINAYLVGSPGSFTVTSLTGAQNLGSVEFSMMYVSSGKNPMHYDFRYQGEFGSSFQSHQGTVTIGKAF